MTNVKTFGGIDVSKKFFDVCIMVGSKKQQVHQFNYDEQGLKALNEYLAGYKEGVHCVMEATGAYYMKLAMYLHGKGYAVSVVNPLVIKRFSQMRLIRTKTDKADAVMIAQYAQREQPKLWEPPKDYIIKLQQLEALSDQLQKQRTALLCQSEAFSSTQMMDKEIELLMKSNIVHLEKQLEKIAERMETIIGGHHRQMLNNVESIPGIGRKTAIVLIVLSGGFKKFSNYRQLSAYIGLSPRIYESGSSVKGKARICKMGMSRIRALLYVCAWSAKRCNKACKDLYDRLVEKGKSKRLALIAVANKLVKQVFAIATSNQPYQENYSKNICF